MVAMADVSTMGGDGNGMPVEMRVGWLDVVPIVEEERGRYAKKKRVGIPTLSCSLTRIRTWTDRTKTCSATITP